MSKFIIEVYNNDRYINQFLEDSLDRVMERIKYVNRYYGLSLENYSQLDGSKFPVTFMIVDTSFGASQNNPAIIDNYILLYAWYLAQKEIQENNKKADAMTSALKDYYEEQTFRYQFKEFLKAILGLFGFLLFAILIIFIIDSIFGL